ncbi:MAG TPA: hypothetical protein VE090_00950 [Methylomirabilota bacterium]|nr:hypothetical protein [Methylomirabilota bacterium]
MFSEAETNFVEFFQERLVFFNVPKRDGTKRSAVKASLYDYVTVSPGKISYDLNFAGFNSKSANIAFGLQKRGFDSTYYQKKTNKNNNIYKKGLIYCVIAKIAFESLYCFLAEAKGDEKLYRETILDEKNNWHKHRKSVYEYITKANTKVVNNILSIGSYKGQYSDWNININYVSISFIGEYPIIWLRILGLLFLVNYLPKANESLTKEKVWELVKEHNNKFIKDLIDKGKDQGISSYHLDQVKNYYIS